MTPHAQPTDPQQGTAGGMMPASLGIIAACVVGFLVQDWFGLRVEYPLSLWPLDTGYMDSRFRPWQLVTHALLHRDFLHLMVNMLAVFLFGPDIERLLGSSKFAIYFLVCVISGALTNLLVMHVTGDLARSIGASGGSYGVLLAYGFIFPKRKLMLIFPPIPIPAWLLVTMYGAVEIYSGVFQTNSGVGHFAHLGGMIGGLALLLVWRAWRLTRRPGSVYRF